ncbi:MAG TPA: acyltransferase [Capillimicrobium sp.]|nr:acyltransferase [Capillimicrobium sp.]
MPPAARSQIDQLDGVRALAVLAVMAFHVTLVREGYWGVDVFFVLSGMLITGILVGELDRTGTVALGRFFERRMLRLYPALVAMLVVLSPFGVHLAQFGTWPEWWESVAVALTYTGNLAILNEGVQYLGALTPVWSLAVEMQFYLVWPPVLVWLLRRGVDRRALTAGTALAALACLSLFWLLETDPQRGLGVAQTYFRPDARFGELLCGCALALLLSLHRGDRLRPALDRALSVLAVAGLAGFVLAAELYDRWGSMVPVPVVVLATALVLARLVTSDRALLSRLLRLPPLPQIGRISYAMYLWQVPILWLVEWRTDSQAIRDVVFWGGTLAVAWLSMRFVERPFLRRKDRLRTADVAEGIGGRGVSRARAAASATPAGGRSG